MENELDLTWGFERLYAYFAPRADEVVFEQELLKEFFRDYQFHLSVTLELFQKHFLLYRRLYLFDEELRQRNLGFITIELIRICYHSEQAPQLDEALLPVFNPLKNYYLDWNNLNAMSEQDLKTLMEGFYEKIFHPQDIDKAYKVFDLKPGCSLKEIESRWKTLSLKNHPDHGGSPETFLALVEARNLLRMLF